MKTNYKFKVYKYNPNSRPSHVTDFVVPATSLFQALRKFMGTCQSYIDIHNNAVSNWKDLNVYSARSLARITCKIEVEVDTVHVTLSGYYSDFDRLFEFEL